MHEVTHRTLGRSREPRRPRLRLLRAVEHGAHASDGQSAARPRYYRASVPASPSASDDPFGTGALTDVAGLRVGHHQRFGRGWQTGTTVVLAPDGAVAAVDVRGGGPGTRETDALDARNLVDRIHAVCLTGGSAYGLAAADGVMAHLERKRLGIVVGPEPQHVVPVVPTAVIFDLGRGGGFGNRPDAGFGERAASAARPRNVARGAVGAGTGARSGGMPCVSIARPDAESARAMPKRSNGYVPN